jgi:hypothetical protein
MHDVRNQKLLSSWDFFGGVRPEGVFTVAARDPVEVTVSDVFEFLAHQRGDRSVVRLASRESGLSAWTIARRLSTVSGQRTDLRRTGAFNGFSAG